MKILILVEGVLLDESKAPIKNAVEKINKWVEQGAEILYLTTAVKFTEVKAAKDAVKNANFPGDTVQARREGESFREVLDGLKPNVFIELENIEELISVKLPADSAIFTIVVKSGDGLELLPESLDDLKVFGKKEKIVAEQ
jgi:hypothetical protein